MVVLVCGSRDWPFPGIIEEELEKLPKKTIIMHGKARGADKMADEIAKRLGFKVKAYPADWKRYGKAAGIIRNNEMLDEEPDKVLAFQLDESRGTQHTINEARKRGIKVKVIHATISTR